MYTISQTSVNFKTHQNVQDYLETVYYAWYVHNNYQNQFKYIMWVYESLKDLPVINLHLREILTGMLNAFGALSDNIQSILDHIVGDKEISVFDDYERYK